MLRQRFKNNVLNRINLYGIECGPVYITKKVLKEYIYL